MSRNARTWLQGEPDIEEMLRDPVVHLVMARDGLTPQMLRRALRAGGERLLSAAGAVPAAAGTEDPAPERDRR